MMQAKLVWDGDTALDQITKESWQRFQRMVQFFWDHVQQTLNVPNSGVRVRRQRNTVAGKKGSSYTIYPNPSKPGEAPRKRTGWLQRHTLREFDKASLTARVGVGEAAKYGLFLELGMNRPWLLATLNRIRPQLDAIMGKP